MITNNTKREEKINRIFNWKIENEKHDWINSDVGDIRDEAVDIFESGKMKICNKCNRLLEITCFHKDSSKSDGLMSCCKECRKPIIKKWQKTYREKHKECSLKYRQNHPERCSKTVREYKEKHIKESKVRTKLSNAVRDGKVKRGECAVCGKEKTEGHHYDYNKPLDVVWLCRLHHAMLHSGELTAQDFQHDCHNDPDDGCQTCGILTQLGLIQEVI